jgi:hypothetical protein
MKIWFVHTTTPVTTGWHAFEFDRATKQITTNPPTNVVFGQTFCGRQFMESRDKRTITEERPATGLCPKCIERIAAELRG